MGIARKLRDNFRGPRDVWHFLRTGPRLLYAHRMKPRLSVSEILARFTKPVRRPPDEPHIEALVRYIDWWVARSWFPVHHNCWTRSLVLFELLRAYGIGDAHLHIGIDARGGDVTGHAWLVRNGARYLDRPPEDVDQLRVIVVHPPDGTTGDGGASRSGEGEPPGGKQTSPPTPPLRQAQGRSDPLSARGEGEGPKGRG